VIDSVIFLQNPHTREVWFSTDFGVTLQPISTLPSDQFSYYFGTAESGMYVIVNESKVFRSARNNPTVFQAVPAEVPDSIGQSSASFYSFVAGEVLFAVKNLIYWRFDGIAWAKCPTLANATSGFPRKGMGRGNELFLYHPYYFGPILYSNDAGKTFDALPTPPQLPMTNTTYTYQPHKTDGHVWLFVRQFSNLHTHLYSWPFQTVSTYNPLTEPFTFTLSPNPAHGQCMVTLNAPINQPATVQVFDASSRLVVSKHYDQLPLQFSLPQWSSVSGVYFVQVHTQESVVTRKLIVE
jgi:Secretion system C-terminal sorting domain